MKISEGWKIASKAIKKTNIPAWNGIRLSSKEGKATLSGRSAEVFIKCNLTEDLPECNLVLPLGVGEILPHLDSPQIEIEGNTVVFVSGRSRFRFQAIAPDDFGEFPALDGEPIEGDFSAASLVAYAASQDETRQVLQGIHFVNRECAATDGHRLAVCPSTIPLQKVTVPSKTIPILQGMGKVTVRHDSSLTAENDQMAVWVRLLEPIYPNYRLLFPTTPEFEFEFSADAIIPILNRSLLCESRCRIDFDDSGMKVITESPTEFFEEQIPAKVPKPLTFHISQKYLLAAIKQFNGTIKMLGTGATQAFVLKSSNAASGEALVMPIAIR